MNNQKTYHSVNIKPRSKITIEKDYGIYHSGIEKYVIDIEDDEQIVRLHFNDLQTLLETVFFEIAEKVQPYMRGGGNQ